MREEFSDWVLVYLANRTLVGKQVDGRLSDGFATLRPCLSYAMDKVPIVEPPRVRDMQGMGKPSVAIITNQSLSPLPPLDTANVEVKVVDFEAYVPFSSLPPHVRDNLEAACMDILEQVARIDAKLSAEVDAPVPIYGAPIDPDNLPGAR